MCSAIGSFSSLFGSAPPNPGGLSHFVFKSPFLRSKSLLLASRHLFLPSKPFLFASPIYFQPLQAHRHEQQQQGERWQQQQQQDVVDVSLLPPKLQEIIALFQSVPEPKAKYQQLLHYGARLPPLDPRFKTEEHRVRGCVSQVWVRAFVDPNDSSAVHFEADSDSALTKGLAALLVFGLSGSPAPVIARVPPQFVHLLGLRQSLTPSRNNGFLNMLKLMQHKSLQLFAQSSDSDLRTDSSAKVGTLEDKDLNFNAEEDSVIGGVNGSRSFRNYHSLIEKEESSEDGVDSSTNVLSINSSGGGGGRMERIREILVNKLDPVELKVEDISHLHAGHAAVRENGGGETHFNVRVVSNEFEGKSLVKRHRFIYEQLQQELQNGLHALSIDAKTPSEVQSS